VSRFRKLCKMSLNEVAVRVRAASRTRRERRSYYRPSRNGESSSARSNSQIDVDRFLDAVVTLAPGARQSDLKRLECERPQICANLAASARSRGEAVLSGNWPLLGHPVDLRGDVDWHCDPRTGKRWPNEFYADLRLSDPAGSVDVKFVWELGRQQYLVELARGWLFAGDQRYAERTKELMLDWIGSNPLYEGIHWTSALEVAMRAISWLWALATLARWGGWQDDDLCRIAASLQEHARYLEHHFSFYSSPYNHLIGEATGLYLIGIALSELDESVRWKEAARRVLIEHGPRQFYDDGFCVEQATGYHFYTLGFLALAIAAARAEGARLEELEPVVHRAFRAGAALEQPDGRWPAVGDVDSARSIPVFHEDFWDFRSLCSLGAALFEDGDLKVDGAEPGEELYWVLGCEGVASWTRLPAAEPNRRAVLPDSGYAVAKRDGDWLLFDAGPIAGGLHADATPSTGHGHADALQVLIGTGGKPALIDSGMPFYYGSPDWVRHFRNPAAHNTLEIDGAPIVRNAGGLNWSCAPERPRLEANLSEEAWLAQGSLKWKAAGKRRSEVYVERHLLGLPARGLWIADWIETDRPRRVRWFWQMPAGTVGRVSNSGPLVCHTEGEELKLTLWSYSVPIRGQLETPTEDRPAGWNATGYGVYREGQRLCHEADAATRLLVVAYVGLSPAPVDVVMRGQRIVCAMASFDEQLVRRDAFPAQNLGVGEIAWRVWTEQGPLVYVAGKAAIHGDCGQTPLQGVGGWPAFTFRGPGSACPSDCVPADTQWKPQAK